MTLIPNYYYLLRFAYLFYLNFFNELSVECIIIKHIPTISWAIFVAKSPVWAIDVVVILIYLRWAPWLNHSLLVEQWANIIIGACIMCFIFPFEWKDTIGNSGNFLIIIQIVTKRQRICLALQVNLVFEKMIEYMRT